MSQKPRSASRVSAFFRRGRSPATLGQPASGDNTQAPVPSPYADKGRARDRYLKAVSLLEDALKGRNEKWGNFEIPKLEGELENVNPEEFRGKVEALCKSYSVKRDLNAFGKCAHAVECCFTAFAPFAKNFLAIAKESSQVRLSTSLRLITRSPS